MKFSVVVPVYNVEAYLEQCVDSILNQSFADFELILVDDGSQDGSGQICDCYAQENECVKVIHQQNGGLSAARNTGIRMATGEYLLFVDSDDYWLSDQVLYKINEMTESDHVQIVHFDKKRIFMRQNKEEEFRPNTLSRYNGLSGSETLEKLVSGSQLTISACLMAISRAFVVKNELYFTEGIKTEDLEWAIRVYLCEPRWAFLDDCFYVYRVGREGSITSSIGYKHLCDYCWILEQSVSRTASVAERVKSPLMSYLMYHVLIASALTYRTALPKKEKTQVLARLKAVSKGRITHYTMDKKVRMASTIYRIAGFGIMARVLGFYLSNRGH